MKGLHENSSATKCKGENTLLESCNAMPWPAIRSDIENVRRRSVRSSNEYSFSSSSSVFLVLVAERENRKLELQIIMMISLGDAHNIRKTKDRRDFETK